MQTFRARLAALQPDTRPSTWVLGIGNSNASLSPALGDRHP
jgi:hypothetical protein